MTLTRETVEKLLAKMTFEVINGEMNLTLAEEVGSALLAAWVERDALMAAVQANLLRPNYVRAEAAEAKLAERDAEIARLRDGVEVISWIDPEVIDVKGQLEFAIAAAKTLLNKEPTP